MRITWRRVAAAVALLVVAVIVVAAAGAVVVVRRSYTTVDGESRLPGLDQPAQVLRDANEIGRAHV